MLIRETVVTRNKNIGNWILKLEDMSESRSKWKRVQIPFDAFVHAVVVMTVA